MKTNSKKAKSQAKSKKSSLQNGSQTKRQTQNAKTRSQSRGDTDIATLILKDHEPIKKLILVLKDSEVGITKKRIAYAEFEHLLSSHAKAEEKTLYIKMKKETDLKVEGLEGDIEHELADQLMKQIDQIRSDADLWTAKVKVLAELVDHHVKEEEKEVLKEIKLQFDSDERAELGEEYQTLLKQIRSEQDGNSKYNDKEIPRSEYV